MKRRHRRRSGVGVGRQTGGIVVPLALMPVLAAMGKAAGIGAAGAAGRYVTQPVLKNYLRPKRKPSNSFE